MSNQPTTVQQLAPVRRRVTPKEARELEDREGGKKRKADASMGGSSAALRKRKEEDVAPAPARHPDEEIIAEYRCPITQELPVDPVVAEDGQCYDRAAIEEWFEKHDSVKSPMSNQPIGKKLMPAFQMRNAIERLISKGILTGEAAEAWTERQEELGGLEEEWREELAAAYKGKAAAMCNIGLCYREGHWGFKKDQSKAIEWLQKGAAADEPRSICNMAIFYLNGCGVTKDTVRGMLQMTHAAMLGSEHAASCIGNYYATGSRFTSGKDATEASRWYKFSRKCSCKDSIDDFRFRRDEWLKARGQLEDAPGGEN